MEKNKYRKSVFIVVYSLGEEGRIEYVVLKRKKHWEGWEFPKGGVEKGESLIDAARREIREELGLEFVKIKKFRISGKYDYARELEDRPGVVGQTYTLFAAEVKKGKIRIDEREHYFGEWMEFEEAEKILTYDNQKECLKTVDAWLNKSLLKV